MTNPSANPALPPVRLLGADVEFVKGKLADAEKSLKFREESETVWREGTDKSWRAVGCKMTKQQRLEVSSRHGRIAVKCRCEVKMYKEVLARLQAPLGVSDPALKTHELKPNRPSRVRCNPWLGITSNNTKP